MKKVVFYESCDGRLYKTQEECLKHDLCSFPLSCIIKMSTENSEDCGNCPLFSSCCSYMNLIDKKKDLSSCN